MRKIWLHIYFIKTYCFLRDERELDNQTISNEDAIKVISYALYESLFANFIFDLYSFNLCNLCAIEYKIYVCISTRSTNN